MASSDNIVTIRDRRGRYLRGTPGGPGRPLGSRNRLSEDFLGDLHEDWRQHGKEILATMRGKFPEVYFQSFLKLAVHNVELGQPGEFEEQVHSKEEVLQKLEEHSGPARASFSRTSWPGWKSLRATKTQSAVVNPA